MLQPDIRHCGGILEMRKIAAYAEVHYIAIAPHSAADAVGVAASIQAAATIPNLLIHEFGGGAGEGLFKTPLVFNQGTSSCRRGPASGSRSTRPGWSGTSCGNGGCAPVGVTPGTARSTTSDSGTGD